MAIQNKRLRRLLFRGLPVLAAVAVILISLVLVSDVQRDTGGLQRHYLWVLVLTGVALLLLLASIVLRMVSLWRRVRGGTPGARLSARWVRNFLMLSLPPALIVYVFSAYFLTRTVDSWFDVEVEAALADSLQLGRQFLDLRTLEVRNRMLDIGAEIGDLVQEPELLRQALLDRVDASGPLELSVLGADGGVLATANYNPLALLLDRPGDYALLQAIETGEYAAAEPDAAGGLQIRVLRSLPPTRPGQATLMLQAIFPLPASITALTASIEEEYYDYQNVSYLRDSLKQSFLLILSLVLLLTVLLAILAALNSARRMVAPISRLAQATREVARGDLEQAVEIQTRDELGFLARAFNDMTEALLVASEEAESGRAQLKAQGDYLETVLGSLSAGVATLDADGRMVRTNRAAERILRLPRDLMEGNRLPELPLQAPHLQPLADFVQRQLERDSGQWQKEIVLDQPGAPLVLLVRGSRLPGAGGGCVIVFDDVTVLNQAQRDAAWAEVARRLAHEVKNPLTPIRLAAERLRMKLMDKLDARDAQMLERGAGTIVAQVEALRGLVDAFGDYAREPELDRSRLKLDPLIAEVSELYLQGHPGLHIDLEPGAGQAILEADAGQIRQLLHNLIRNACEAAGDAAKARIRIDTRPIRVDGTDWLRLEVRDHGPGYPDSVLRQPFEPYVTHKQEGRGLGLAICRKIVEDHDGRIAIGNPEGGGASAVILLPLTLGQPGTGEARDTA
ncbi:MAG: HAMP domain-containing protein [Xanthomonadales bacterium]|nr:HAMP domain-containing protein [Xanthomonadales bacterium]NIN60134.1 HAMP domain-containing protein [Xanthomonadales bacterium]NIN74281.1 HAMP domain-containing protein [Xanthomonadales bacterium]NIO12790.1 HAMP domain-containing protein [Xanthomonadales bacterium]NIP12527.1 HAMP domain-containing protein [Xanthomonadales bacterium]